MKTETETKKNITALSNIIKFETESRLQLHPFFNQEPPISVRALVQWQVHEVPEWDVEFLFLYKPLTSIYLTDLLAILKKNVDRAIFHYIL